MSLTLAKVINDTTSSLGDVQVSLNSLTGVARAEIIALGFYSAGPGESAISSPPCCTWTDALAERKAQYKRLRRKPPTWLSQVDLGGLWDLFSWLSS